MRVNSISTTNQNYAAKSVKSAQSHPNFEAGLKCDISEMRALCENPQEGANFFMFLSKLQKAITSDKKYLSLKISEQAKEYPENLKFTVRALSGETRDWGYHLNMKQGNSRDWVNGALQTINHIRGLF